MQEFPVSDIITKQVYDYIEQYILDFQYPPSMGEIANDLYYSKNTIHLAIKKLESKGLIESDGKKGEARCIRLPSLQIVRRENYGQ